VSAACIERAREDNPQACYETYDGARLPYGDAGFDMAIATCVVHHVAPGQWAGFAAELKRMLRPGGLACLIEHNPLNPLTRLSVMRCAFDADAVLLPRRRAETLLREAGLTQVSSRYFVFLPSTQPWALGVERRLAGVPLGAQYITLGRA
jgi:SAM-dependent methyltransferase